MRITKKTIIFALLTGVVSTGGHATDFKKQQAIPPAQTDTPSTVKPIQVNEAGNLSTADAEQAIKIAEGGNTKVFKEMVITGEIEKDSHYTLSLIHI